MRLKKSKFACDLLKSAHLDSSERGCVSSIALAKVDGQARRSTLLACNAMERE